MVERKLKTDLWSVGVRGSESESEIEAIVYYYSRSNNKIGMI